MLKTPLSWNGRLDLVNVHICCFLTQHHGQVISQHDGGVFPLCSLSISPVPVISMHNFFQRSNSRVAARARGISYLHIGIFMAPGFFHWGSKHRCASSFYTDLYLLFMWKNPLRNINQRKVFYFKMSLQGNFDGGYLLSCPKTLHPCSQLCFKPRPNIINGILYGRDKNI